MPDVPPPPPLPSIPGATTPKTSTVAIWSLVLGIFAIFTCGLTAIPGLITGIMGISATNERGRGLAIAGVVTSSLALAVVVPLALAVHAFTKEAETVKLAKSVTQAKQLVIVLQLYALDGDGSLPPDWATAFKATGPVGADLLISPLGDDSAEYILLTPGAKLDDLPPDTAIVRDPHQMDGQNVVGYANGVVRIERVNAPSR